MSRQIKRQIKKNGVGFLLMIVMASLGCTSISDLSHETYKKGFLKIDPLGKEETVVLEMTSENATNAYLPKAKEIFNILMQEAQPKVLPLAQLSPANVSFSLPQTKKILEESDFSVIRKSTTIRFLLQTHLQQIEVVEGATQVRIEARIWDIEQGDILWEGVGESRGHLFLFFPTAPASFEKAMEVASRGLIRRLPMRRK